MSDDAWSVGPNNRSQTPGPQAAPPAGEPGGTVSIQWPLASTPQCEVFIDRLLVHPAGLQVGLHWRFTDKQTAAEHIGDPRMLHSSAPGGPDVVIRSADGGQIASSAKIPAQDTSGRPAITLVSVQGGHPQWQLRFWIWPLPTEDVSLTVSWPNCGVNEATWPLRRGLIDEGLRRAAELQALRDDAATDGFRIEADLQALGDIAARLADLGATLHTLPPHITREPIVRVPRDDGVVEVNQVTGDYLTNLTSRLEGQTVHVVTVEGAVNGQAIVVGEDAALIARALAMMPPPHRQGGS
ncbi:hypothetical protein [Actinomadura sp. 9N215]|uniref:hypothetical protein n=1 Tax=Actinomadura sp. 9N215 TaxID=3375150 RepID=UPI0037A4ECDA